MENFYTYPYYKDYQFLKKSFKDATKKNKFYVKICTLYHKYNNFDNYPLYSTYDIMNLLCGHKIRAKTIKTYTGKRYNTMIKTKEKIAAETNKLEYAQKLDLNKKFTTYMVVKDNAYKIKDKLEEYRARLRLITNWHTSAPRELLEGYSLYKVSFDKIYKFKPLIKNIEMKEKCKKNY